MRNMNIQNFQRVDIYHVEISKHMASFINYSSNNSFIFQITKNTNEQATIQNVNHFPLFTFASSIL